MRLHCLSRVTSQIQQACGADCEDCQLTYRLHGDQIMVEKQPGLAWLNLAVATLS
jgi:hypothetical protein